MKITYPDCQIEISVEEVIALMKFEEENKPRIVFDPKSIDPLPPFDPDTLREADFDRDQVRDHVQDPLQGVSFEEPALEPGQKSPRLKKPQKKTSGNAKAVQVLFENGWKTYKTVSKAADAIGTKLNHLSHALLNGKTCNGYQVRYAVDSKEQTENTNEEPTELP